MFKHRAIKINYNLKIETTRGKGIPADNPLTCKKKKKLGRSDKTWKKKAFGHFAQNTCSSRNYCKS